jgi:hypothetical protein
LAIFGDDLVGGGVDEGIDFMIAGFGAVPGVGDVFVAARMYFVEQKVDFGWLEGAAGDAAHVIYDIVGHGINLIEVLKIGSGEATGALAADVDAMLAGDFLGKGVRGFAGMVAVGAGAVHDPVQAGCPGFVPEDAFGEGAAADVAEANHQNTLRGHGRKNKEFPAEGDGGGRGTRVGGGRGRRKGNEGWVVVEGYWERHGGVIYGMSGRGASHMRVIT